VTQSLSSLEVQLAHLRELAEPAWRACYRDRHSQRNRRRLELLLQDIAMIKALIRKERRKLAARTSARLNY